MNIVWSWRSDSRSHAVPQACLCCASTGLHLDEEKVPAQIEHIEGECVQPSGTQGCVGLLATWSVEAHKPQHSLVKRHPLESRLLLDSLLFGPFSCNCHLSLAYLVSQMVFKRST